MSLTEAQTTLLASKRKQYLPTRYDADIGSNVSITQDTEDALILLSSETKQKASQYIDVLLASSTVVLSNDHDTVLQEVVAQHASVLSAQTTELELITGQFETFKDSLTGSGSSDSVFASGTAPLLKAMLRGFGTVQNDVDEVKFASKMNSLAEGKFSKKFSDNAKKELLSWKRLLVSYP